MDEEILKHLITNYGSYGPWSLNRVKNTTMGARNERLIYQAWLELLDAKIPKDVDPCAVALAAREELDASGVKHRTVCNAFALNYLIDEELPCENTSMAVLLLARNMVFAMWLKSF